MSPVPVAAAVVALAPAITTLIALVADLIAEATENGEDLDIASIMDAAKARTTLRQADVEKTVKAVMGILAKKDGD